VTIYLYSGSDLSLAQYPSPEPPVGSIYIGRGNLAEIRVNLLARADATTDLINSALSEAAATTLRPRFEELADDWEADTEFGSVRDMALHRSYQQIIGMGRDAVPLILERLRDRPNHWFWALSAITGEDPAAGLTDFDEATHSWLEWGRRGGLL